MGDVDPLRRRRSEPLPDPGQGAGAARATGTTARDGEEARPRCAPPPDLRAARPAAAAARRLRRAGRDPRAAGARRARSPVVLISGCSRTPEYSSRAQACARRGSPHQAGARSTRCSRRSPASSPAFPAPPSTRGAGAAAPGSDRSGTFAELPFPALLLHQLHGLRASGVLAPELRPQAQGLQLHDGVRSAVRSNLVNECLGNLLVRIGRITPRSCCRVARRMKRRRRLQGEILVAMHLLSEDELAIALRPQAEEKLFEIFGWTDGRFASSGGQPPARQRAAVERSPADLILEGVRTRLPIERIDALPRGERGPPARAVGEPLLPVPGGGPRRRAAAAVRSLEKPRADGRPSRRRGHRAGPSTR